MILDVCGTIAPSCTANTVEGAIPKSPRISLIVTGASDSKWSSSPSCSTVTLIAFRVGSALCLIRRWAKHCRDRIARYCGGFEIHCPLDAGVQIPLSAPLLFLQIESEVGFIIRVAEYYHPSPRAYSHLRSPRPLAYFSVEYGNFVASCNCRGGNGNELLESDRSG